MIKMKHLPYISFSFARWSGLKTSCTISNYCSIIEIIYEEHKMHTGKWLSNLPMSHYNLKKKQVRNVCSSNPDDIDNFVDSDFLLYIDSFKSTLGILYAKILRRVKDETGVTLVGRIKNDDSILLKLHRKRFEDEGKFPLNKYLNDLLGFRIIDNNFNQNVGQVKSFLTEYKEQKGRIVHKYRENGEYKGYHVYFMGLNSKTFPVELQIWDYVDEVNNLESHESYKKDYTYWPEIYHKGK